MQEQFDARHMERERIAFELAHRLGFDRTGAHILARHEVFDAVTVSAALERIQMLAETLGPHLGRTLIGQKPQALGIPTDRLAQRLEDLRKDGYSQVQATRILSLCLEVAGRQSEDFYRTHNVLCSLFPIRELRHAMVNAHPEVYLIPSDLLERAQRLEPCDDPEPIWQELCRLAMSGESPPESAATKRWQRMRVPQDAIPLVERLLSLHLPCHSARAVAVRLLNAFEDSAERMLERFLERGWSARDVATLARNERNVGWRSDPAVLFDSEDLLVELGFPRDDAREIVIECDLLAVAEPERIRQAVSTFKELGYDLHDIIRFASMKPRSLTIDPATIREWHETMRSQGKHPGLCLGMLLRDPATWRKRTHKGKTDVTTDPTPDPEPAPPTARKPTKPPAPLPARVVTIKPPPSPKQLEDEYDDDDEPAAGRSDDDEDVDTHHVRDWQSTIEQILGIVVADWTERKWRTYRRRHSWMWARSGPAPAALHHLAHWVGLPGRVRDAKIVVESRWPREEDEADGEADDKRPRQLSPVEFFGRILTDAQFHPVLKLPVTALQHRLGAIRRIADADFLVEPELLLFRWERFSPVELRTRVYEIERRGKRANRPPFLIMLVEPTREDFLARLELYL